MQRKWNLLGFADVTSPARADWPRASLSPGECLGKVAQCPVLHARPLSRSGTGERASEARLPNRQIKHVLRALAVKGHQQNV